MKKLIENIVLITFFPIGHLYILYLDYKEATHIKYKEKCKKWLITFAICYTSIFISISNIFYCFLK